MDLKKQLADRKVLGGSLPFKKRCFRTIEQQLHGKTTETPAVALTGKAPYFPSNSLMPDLTAFTNSFIRGRSESYLQKVRTAGSAFSEPHGHAARSTVTGTTNPVPERCQGPVPPTQDHCQRLPRDKGSNYVNRHFEQDIRKQGRALKKSESKVTGESSARKGLISSKTAAAPHSQQDKRFTGAEGECRCSATTTRGRECAYAAVDGTKYCYMHADYDINPPPRRGGKLAGGGASSTDAPVKSGKKKETPRSVSNVSDSSSKSSVDRKRRSTAEKLAQKHADSPFPLLSMISSDQWANKRVKVSVGPFEGRSGRVEKWSNGWVGVRIPGIGLHNRRSFELYLDSEDAVKGKLQDTNIHDKASIMRSVSRDTVTSSPVPLQGKRTPSPKGQATKPSSTMYQPVTPNLTIEESEGRLISRNRSLHGLGVVSLPEVTPTGAHAGRACVDPPLVESLLQSQDHVPKLDMLFGSAAVDRGRRSVKRPKIYEDTEMLDKKRSRKVSPSEEGAV